MRSPATGIVVSRNIFLGLKFIQGPSSSVSPTCAASWIFLDVYENETQFLKQGARPKVSVGRPEPALRGRGQRGPAPLRPREPDDEGPARSREPGLRSSADMFVDVELPVALEATLSVPRDAILDTGLKRTVFVDRGGGFFEPGRLRRDGASATPSRSSKASLRANASSSRAPS